MRAMSKSVVGTTALLILLSGCHKSATGQVVAVVNGEEVSQQELNAELQGISLPASVDRKKVMAALLQRVVDRKLLVQQAKKQGLDRSPDYLEQSRRLNEALLVQILERNTAKGIAIPDSAAVDKYITDHPTMFANRQRYSLEQISFATPPDLGVLKQLQPAHSLEAVGAVLTAAGIAFTRGDAVLDTATLSPEASDRITKLPPGEPFITPSNGGFVVSVIKSAQPVPTTDREAKPAATGLLRQQSVNAAMRKQLDTDRSSAKIQYQPGFEPAVKPKTNTLPSVPAQ